MERIRRLENLCWALAAVLLTVYAAVGTDARLGKAQALESFAMAKASAAGEAPLLPDPDQSAWSPGRIEAWRQSFTLPVQGPEGVLSFPTFGHAMPIFAGTDEVALNRGVGWIEGTAPLEGTGNVGIAGHRDGYFRILKDIGVGDPIQVETLEGSRTFRVTETLIVDPTGVHVLAPTQDASLTLVTCYPFYFVGQAPQRFIVRAVLDDALSTSMQ